MELDSMMGSGLVALIIGSLVVFLIIGVLLWIYFSFAYVAIGRKAKDPVAGLAWIPGFGPLIIAFRASGMHWWPWLLIIATWIPLIGIIAQLVFLVYAIIWQWKLFEAIGKPGWWAILCLIPVVNLIIIGIAAWSD
jgi:hypothetical protein